ncbi:choice-of-anchor L domain-containing protein, partial [Flavobacterium sp.]|uniref:choice-of-anchor L domain-containing protein n=1 Tax=Flavobacterium sp. TaxID=239 RepID=UPI0012284567
MKKTLLLLFFFFLSVSAFSQADIVVTNSDYSNYYIPGTTSTYTVTVTNFGPNAATNVNVQNAIPNGIEYFSWTGSNGSSGVNDPLNNTIANLPVGQTVTYTIWMEIPASMFGPLTSTTAVTSTSVDPNPTCPQCVDTNVRALGADLEVTNTDNQTQYVPGGTNVYTVTVHNNGPLTAANVVVSNPIPAGIPAANFSWTGSNGSSGTGVPLNNTAPSIVAGSSVVYTVTIQIPTTFTGNLTSTVSTTTPSIDPVPGCAGCTDVDTQGFGADLEITNTDGQTTYVSGTTNTYTVTVTNNGPGVATGVQVDNAIPAGIPAGNFSWNGSNGSSGTGIPLSDLIPTMAPGTTITYTILVNIPGTLTAPSLTSQVVVTSTSTDPTPACTQCTDTDTYTFGADLVVTNTDYNVTYVPGTNNTYIVTVTNLGPLAATNVIVTNPIPAGITAFSWTGTNGSNGTNVALNNTIPTLVAGATVTYTITLGVPAGFTGPLTSVANATSVTPDPNPGCTTCSDTDTQAPAGGADLVVNKTDGVTSFTPGSSVVYTITVHNNGPNAATNVDIVDNVPAGVPAANVTWTGPGSTTGTGNINQNFASVAVGQTLTYTVTVLVPASFDQATNLVNTVAVTSDTPDPNPGCATCTDTDTPFAYADLVTFKTDNSTTYNSDGNVTYNISITNLGPSDAVNVQVNDPLPNQITTMNWAGSNGSSGTGALSDLIASIPAGTMVTYQVTIAVPENYNLTNTTLTNTVSVSSPTPDPVPACGGCTDTSNASPRHIEVKNDIHTLAELVEDVLIHSECAEVDNITAIGYSASQNSSIGYFRRQNADFPFKDGVVMASAGTGFLAQHYNNPPGETAGTGFNNPGPGNVPRPEIQDLQTISNSIPLNGNKWLQDYSEIKFNFTPLTTSFSFNFLFSSEEYGFWQCTFGDVFAFILKDITAGTPGVNLAVVPNTNTPIGVTSIHDIAYNGNCVSENAQYFDLFSPSIPSNQTPVNIQGLLYPMTAAATVIPNHVYEIKLCVADLQDTALATAVFIEGGSFNVGQTNLVGEGFENDSYNEWPDLVGPAAVCPGQPKTLFAGSSPIAGATYQWYLNDLLIPGETNYSIVIDEAGIYSVVVAIGGGCQQTDNIVVEYQPDMPLEDSANLVLPFCAGQPIDLSEIEPDLINGHPEFMIDTYEDSEPNAQVQAGSIGNYNNYMGTDGEVIWVSVIDPLGGSECFGIRYFTLQEITPPQAIQLPNESVCDCFTLQALPAGQFYNSASDGTGTAYVSGDQICSNATLYVIADINTPQACRTFTSFTISVNATPVVPVVADVTVCDSYTLPTLPAGQFYNTASNGSGVTYPAGQVFNTNQTIWVVSGTNPICQTSADFDITIIPTPQATQLADVSWCDCYTLAAIPAGQVYNTASNGTGTAYAAGDLICSNITLYVIAESGTTPNCRTFTDFDIVITPTPTTPVVANVTACDTYSLPTLPAGQFYNTLSDGTGTTYPVGHNVTATETIWVVSGNNPSCQASASFVVTINVTPTQPSVSDVTACDSYQLPVLAAGQYYNTQSGGTGTTYPAGQIISNTETIWVIAETGTTPNCLVEDSFLVTINPTPAVPTVSNVTACDTYSLPALAAGQFYNTLADGTGTTYPTGYSVTATQTIWVVAQTGTVPNICQSSASFVVTINVTPTQPSISDVTACDSYQLPVLAAGQYYNTQSGGTGTTYPAGQIISNTETIWVIAETGTTPNCLVEDSFLVTINPTPAVPTVANVTACDTYSLPALAAGQFYNTLADGTGTTYPTGYNVTSTETIWVVAQTGTAPNICQSSASFVVTINVTPTQPSASDVTTCDSYQLPVLAAGQYYNTQSGGTGTTYPAGQIISNTETIWVIAETGTTPNCLVEDSFLVTINPTPAVPTVANVTACDTYALPALAAGQFYNTLADGTGTTYPTGYSVTATQTIWVVAQTGTAPNICQSSASFVVTINVTPQADAPANVSACQQYALPALTAGQYFNGPNGTGGSLSAGTVLTASQTVYVYAETGTTPNCSTQNSFTV